MIYFYVLIILNYIMHVTPTNNQMITFALDLGARAYVRGWVGLSEASRIYVDEQPL